MDDMIRADQTPGANPPLGNETAVVTLSIPCAAEYVGTARLTILGVASRMGLTYDQIEDLRLAVGEACANAIERCSRHVRGPGAGGPIPLLTIRSHVDAAKMAVEVEDEIPAAPAALPDMERPAAEINDMNTQELGALLMEILVDEVTVDAIPGGGARVRLVKYAGVAADGGPV